jgi:hypothetical protein
MKVFKSLIIGIVWSFVAFYIFVLDATLGVAWFSCICATLLTIVVAFGNFGASTGYSYRSRSGYNDYNSYDDCGSYGGCDCGGDD